jgi:cardiolipin synthase
VTASGPPAGTADLAGVAAELARCLPTPHAEALAAALDEHLASTPAARGQVLDAIPTLRYRQATQTLLAAWTETPAVPGPALALAVRAAAGAAGAVRAEQSVEIVWTGPVTDQVPVRRTRQVLLDVIDGATRRLRLLSFAAYRVPAVVEALTAASERGVQIDLVLETALASGGRLTVDASGAFADVAEAVRFWVWPSGRRPTQPSGSPASLHAKAAVADGNVALVTSANLTASAIEANMELGLLVRGGPVPRRLDQHVSQLIADGVLERVPPQRG